MDDLGMWDAPCKGRGVNVSYRTIADRMNVSERTAIRYAHEAARIGLVEKHTDCELVMYVVDGFVDIKAIRANWSSDGYPFICGTGSDLRVCCQHSNRFVPSNRSRRRIYAVINSKKRRAKSCHPLKGHTLNELSPLTCVSAREYGAEWCKDNYERVVTALAR